MCVRVYMSVLLSLSLSISVYEIVAAMIGEVPPGRIRLSSFVDSVSQYRGLLHCLCYYRSSLLPLFLFPLLASNSGLSRNEVQDLRFSDYKRARGDISKVKGCFPRLPDLPY